MNGIMQGISVSREQWALMEADVSQKLPEEACGIALGERGQIRQVIPITNALHSTTQFRMDPQEELHAFTLAEQKSWEVLAIYHSHPHGKGEPSPTDQAELTFPGVIYLIWYQEANLWQCRGFLMSSDQDAKEVPIIIL